MMRGMDACHAFRIDAATRPFGRRLRPWLLVAAASMLGAAAWADVATPAGSAGRAAPASAPAFDTSEAACRGAATQAHLNACAHETFLAASAALAEASARVEVPLAPSQRTAWRRVQQRWMAYRTEACRFESSGVAGGSVQPMVQWQCAARLTRERAAELERRPPCEEGDVSCVRPLKP